jgi:hypothetical protein
VSKSKQKLGAVWGGGAVGRGFYFYFYFYFPLFIPRADPYSEGRSGCVPGSS